MAKGTRITPKEVVEMNRLYKELGTYRAVARKMNRSADTVAKYVKMRDVPEPIRIAVRNLMEKAK